MQANPNLQPLAVLVGEWSTVGVHPLLSGKALHGRTTFSWLESGAFLRFQMHIEETENERSEDLAKGLRDAFRPIAASSDHSWRTIRTWHARLPRFSRSTRPDL
jgi:hypothetical protein